LCFNALVSAFFYKKAPTARWPATNTTNREGITTASGLT
jgi:hypothetical protein